MKLSKLIAKIEQYNFISSSDFIELEKRVKQVKSYFNIDSIKVVAEIVSNAITIYYIGTHSDAADIIEKYGLTDSLESGHIDISVL